MAKFKKGRRPHNAATGEKFENIDELMRILAAERKRAVLNGQEVEMSWGERSFRLTVDRALEGDRRDLAHLLKLMIKHRSISGSYRRRHIIYMSESLSRA